MNEEQENTSESMTQTDGQATDLVKALWRWGKYLLPAALVIAGGLFAIMLFIGIIAGGDDGNCYTENLTKNTGTTAVVGGDWKNSDSETHKAMQYAADQFKNELHMSGDNIAAALAIGLRESGFNPLAVNPSGAVKGIWQWGAGGINGNRYGSTADTVEGQVALAITELRTTHMVTLNHMHDASLQASLDAWDVNFEGLALSDPQRKTEQTAATAKIVKKVFDLNFAGSTATGAGNDGGDALDGSKSGTSCVTWGSSSVGTVSGLPVEGQYNITGGYPNYDGATGSAHYGTDFQTVGAQETGEASNVYSVSDGVVFAKSSDDIGGNYVVIKNTDGSYAYYGHAPSQDAIVVNKGQTVKRGQHISHQGQTGEATGVHVHFGINTKQSSFAVGADGLISPGDYLAALPKKAIPGKGLVAPAGPFTTAEPTKNDDKKDK